MKPAPQNPIDRVRRSLAIGLVALLTASVANAQSDPDAVRRLQEENAALRKRLAEMELRTERTTTADQPATTTVVTTQPTTTVTTMPTSTDPEVTVLSPFQVRTDKDYGYLKTNSATATRIGTEIQKVPLNISVISEEFIRDTQMSDIQDVLRYQSTSSGDTRMGLLQPATGFTPSGNMSLRGFPINSRLRNGLLRYNAYNLDNVERVEVIKGPAAIFFGNAFPGGVINYVTKQASFSKIPTSVNYYYGGYDTRMGSQRVTLDHNHVMSDKAAFRIAGAWDNQKGDRHFEYQKGHSLTPSFSFVPFQSGKLRINLEGEVLKRVRNMDDSSWFYPQQWFADYAAPPAALIAAAGLSGNANPTEAYRTRIFNSIGNWIADKRVAANDPTLPLWTAPLEHGAYYTNRSGQRIHDEKFNYYGRGSYSDEENATFSATVEFSPLDWLDIRYVFTDVQSRFDRVLHTASPYADGVRFNTLNPVVQGYAIDAYYNQLDLVFKKQIAGIDNKVLIGGFQGETYNSFTGTVGANLAGTGQFPFFGNLPGAFDKPDEGYVSPIPVQFRSTTFGPNVAQEFIRDRNGRILTPMEIFSMYDPGVHTSPDITRITEVSRGLVDHSRPERTEWYVNWQGTLMDDRLTLMAGYREEEIQTPGQLVAVNPPWFRVNDYALENIPQEQWTMYGLSAIFSRPSNPKGDSKMAGVSFEVVKDVNVYASYSETFIPSGVKYKGGDYDPNVVAQRATSLGLNPVTENNRLLAEGGLVEMKNEKGKNMEIGVKTSLWDNKLVTTASIFRVRRANRTIDDIQRQFDEPLNWLGPNRTGAQNRIVRWFSNDAVQETEGFEIEGFWTPTRNFQLMFSASWMWDARTVADPSLAPTSPANIIARNIVFSNRLPFAPEYRLNLVPKYTFTDNIVGEYGRGLSVGVPMRYASEIIIANDVNFNPSRGGLTAGDYVVFDAFFSLPFEFGGYRFNASLNVGNVLDEKYSEGGLNLSPPRSWTLGLGMNF
jgi:outer membrane receptor protein involved in Fe transport